jgi:hypothetical protein
MQLLKLETTAHGCVGMAHNITIGLTFKLKEENITP